MRASRPLPAFPSWFKNGLAERVGIDTRTLAAFRISLGSILIVDLLLRTRNLERFYTDAGALPVSVLAEQTPMLAELSLHAQSGGAWFQLVLFALAIIVAGALAIGYKTRLATAVSLLLLLSLHARNPHVLSGGDSLLQHLLFWSMFLPLGERWSVDAHFSETSRDRVLSIASAAILTQVLVVYGVNAVMKHRSEMWMTGDAVEIVFGIDRLTVLLGPVLREFPLLLELGNVAWIVLLLISPLLVLTTGWLRIALITAFAGMHLGMLLTMHLGIFPLISITALVPLLPSEVWKALDRRRAIRRRGSTVTRLLTVFAGRLPRGPPSPMSFMSKNRRTLVKQAIPAVALTGIIFFNLMAIGFVPVPAPVDDTVGEESIDSRWTLFAPHPPSTDRWYVAPGELTNGDQVDAFHQTALRWDRPPDVAGTYSSSRARKFMSNLRYDETLQASFGRYLCERWNRNHDEALVSVRLYAVETPSLTLDDTTRDRTQLVDSSCEPIPAES